MCIHLGRISDTVRMDGRMNGKMSMHNNKAIWEFIALCFACAQT